MIKRVSTWLLAAVLAACLGISGSAVAQEDYHQDCSYPQMFDLTIVRPLSFATTVAGLVLFVPTAPWAALTVQGEVATVWNRLVAEPAGFTFRRPLGACQPPKRL